MMADQSSSMFILPPAADKCQTCATAHEPHLPHNAQSLFYQVAFQMQNNRSPDWRDAWAHCTPEMQDLWREQLIRLGVDVDAGDINPRKATGGTDHD